MIQVELGGDVLKVTCSLPSLGTLVAKVPGSRYQRKGDYWTLPRTRVAWTQLTHIAGPQMGSDEVRQEQQATWEAEAQVVPVPLDAPGLFPYQTVGAGFLAGRRRAILADPQGAGKTAQCLAALVAPALVVAPPTVVGVWAAEAARWRPDLRVVVVGSGESAAKRRKLLAQDADLFVTTYPLVWRHSRLASFGSVKLSDTEKQPAELNRPWATLVLDECHHLLSPEAKTTRACWQLAAEAKRVYALSGTPVRSTKPSDLWACLRLVDAESWPTKSKFVERYASQRVNAWGGVVEENYLPATRDELDSLSSPYILRRSKSDILPDLPEKRFSQRVVPMSPKQAKAYASLHDRMVAELESGELLVCPNPMQRVLRLLQAAAATPLSLDEGVLELGAPSCKADALVEFVEERSGEPTVCFAVSRRVGRVCGEALIKAGRTVEFLDGAVPPGARTRVIEKFQAGGVDALVATYAVGSTGITLTAADCMVRLQRPWSIVDDLQAQDRIHRLGQEASSVEYVDIVTEGTIEPRVVKALVEKASVVGSVVKDPDVLKEWLS